MPRPLLVGLVGAGPWAKMVHAPMLAAGRETTLTGVWSRDFAKASELAAIHGSRPFERYEELLAACEAVAFAVAPYAQPRFAVEAARAGKALLLEKPLAADVPGAESIVNAVAEAGVRSMLMLSYRFSPPVERFIAAARASEPIGGRATFLHAGLLEGPFAFGWRLERGALLDLGPHVIDLACAVFGPVTALKAHGDPLKWVGLLLEHESGARSELSISGSVHANPPKVGMEVYGPNPPVSVDAIAGMGPEVYANIRRAFVETVRGPAPHLLDAAHGLYLQRIIAEAEAQL
jgi:predicted dehydrogenase